MADINCPKCGERFAAADDQRGSAVRCPNCDALLRLKSKAPVAAKPKPVRPKPPPDDDEVIEDVDVVSRPKRVRRRRRQRAAGSFEMPEWLIPVGVFAAAAVTNALLALRVGGEAGQALLVFSLIDLAITVPVTICGMFIAAAALGVNFGHLVTAAIKVAAIVTVVQCIYTMGMRSGGDGSAALVLLIAAPVYWGMFCWFFDLTFVEALQATVLIGLIQKVVNVVVTLAAAGILMKVAERAP
jgi:DNA-directed RNA polymerase subunit RPC12/RpoP